MDTYKNKLEAINDILMKNNLGLMYDIENEDVNPLVMFFFCKYMDDANKIGLDFCITTEQAVRAGIIYHEKLIFVSYGLFDRLCKLSLLVYSSGELNGKQLDFKFSDLHLIGIPFKNKDLELVKGSDERYLLFIFILNSLLCFVISHEAGHYFNDHGKRKKISDDIEGHQKIERKDLIVSHAIELVADSYGFTSLLDYVKDAFLKENKGVAYLLPYYKSDHGYVLLSYIIVGCYFKLMDGHAPLPHFESTHPDSASRLKVIYASTLDHYVPKERTQLKQHGEIIISAFTCVRRIFEYKGGVFNVNWLSNYTDEEMNSWFNEVSQEYENWCK